MSTPEGKLRDKSMQWLKSLPRTYARKVSDSVNCGYPDIDGCHQGLAFYFELKTKTGKLSDRQKYEIDKIQAAGGRAVVVTSLEEIQYWMHIWFGTDKPKARRTRGGDAGGNKPA